MMISTIKLIGMGLLAACLQSGAMAQVIPWQLTGTFADGATLTGRFDYNTAGGNFTDISINTGPGNFQFASELLGWHFDESTVVIPNSPSGGLQFHNVVQVGGGVEDHHDIYFFGFDHTQPVSSAISFIETVILGLNSPGKPSGIFQNRDGQGFAQVIPEPETYALMLAGLGLVVGLSRRRKGKVKPKMSNQAWPSFRSSP